MSDLSRDPPLGVYIFCFVLPSSIQFFPTYAFCSLWFLGLMCNTICVFSGNCI